MENLSKRVLASKIIGERISQAAAGQSSGSTISTTSTPVSWDAGLCVEMWQAGQTTSTSRTAIPWF
eukprot:4383412-Pyramimonas_sp.AAC.1